MSHATFSEDDMIDLMAYADGELEGKDLERVEALLRDDPQAALVVASFGTLGDCVRVTEADRRVPKIVDRIVDDVMEKLPKKPRAAEVIPLAPRAVRMRNAVLAGSVSALLAAAAAWALFFRPGEVAPPPAPVAVQEHAPKPAAPRATGIPSLPVEGTSLDGVESPSQVSVFYVQSDDEKSSSVVVWVGDDNAANVSGGH